MKKGCLSLWTLSYILDGIDSSYILCWMSLMSPISAWQIQFRCSTPSHWSTVSNVNEEIYTVDNLASSSTIVFVVRAQNHHGLSPPSPMSKVSETNELQNIGYFIQILQIYPTLQCSGTHIYVNFAFWKKMLIYPMKIWINILNSSEQEY